MWASVWLVTASLVAGCGGSSTTPGAADGRGSDAGAHASLPLVDYLGGPIVTNPTVVTVTYGADGDPGADPKRALVEAFDDSIASSSACRQGWSSRSS